MSDIPQRMRDRADAIEALDWRSRLFFFVLGGAAGLALGLVA